ncbi:unnamed protein product [Eruca vesicaria subsp. sativa]|uniref:Uncharacterized protein n=1 Tax=Eruca vesicaria subsp. sativa TaxID=29727 RepID=A0ABC8LLF3_ERUVS|nr:unnamed protein product [Eruca vesicaria subsp. sativa]
MNHYSMYTSLKDFISSPSNSSVKLSSSTVTAFMCYPLSEIYRFAILLVLSTGDGVGFVGGLG